MILQLVKDNIFNSLNEKPLNEKLTFKNAAELVTQEVKQLKKKKRR